MDFRLSAHKCGRVIIMLTQEEQSDGSWNGKEEELEEDGGVGAAHRERRVIAARAMEVRASRW